MAQLPALQQKQAEAERRAGNGKHGEKIRQRQPRGSTTDPEARRMKMPNGGFNPAGNVQLATDTESRAIVGIDVTFEGTDSVGLSASMRKQVEKRTEKKVREHLLDGGSLRKEDIEKAGEVELFMPPKVARLPANRGKERNPSRAIVRQYCGGRSVWPAMKVRRSRKNEPPPVKPSMLTSEPTEDSLRSPYVDLPRSNASLCGAHSPTTSSTSQRT